ncbi:eukaryotic translation initiation factor 4G1, eIF4E-binding domain-containing protein [Mycena crocata]|nr:eukaryotic translation initiation factor 4G1, eIF4E-binding domain-containing protein [Mycena crocata]
MISAQWRLLSIILGCRSDQKYLHRLFHASPQIPRKAFLDSVGRELKQVQDSLTQLQAQSRDTLRIAPTRLQLEFHRRRPRPLDLTSPPSKPNIPAAFGSALATARFIDDLSRVPYPENIQRPNVDLVAGANDKKFRYDRDFLLQFMSICKDKPDMLPPLDAIGLVDRI